MSKATGVATVSDKISGSHIVGLRFSTLRRTGLLIALMLSGIAGTTHGQETTESPTISSDRPGQATPPGILVPGYVQIEAGFQLASARVGGEGVGTTIRTLSLPGALVRIGLFQSMELRLATEYRSMTTTISESDTTVSSLTGLSVGAKIGITQEEGAIPEAAFLMTLGMPEIGSESFRPVAVAPGFLLSMRNALSSSVNLYYNLGASWDGISPTGTGFYAALLGITLADNLSGFVEMYGNLKTGALPLHAVDAGLSYVVAPNLQLDLFGGVGITDNASDYFANTGLCVRLPR